MEETILTWSASNWITVLLMVLLGFMALSVLGSVIVSAKGSKENA